MTGADLHYHSNVAGLGGWIRQASTRLARQLGAPVAEVRVVDGVRVEVINTRDDIDTEKVFARAAAILGRIRVYQPARYAHLQRDLARIVVERFACRGAYFAETRTCLLELTFMANDQFSDSQVAACLVHEAMHARLDRMSESLGVPSFEMERARHERICRRAELDFGRAVPDGAPVIERALSSTELSDDGVAPSIDWNEAGRRIASADAEARRTSR